MMTKTNILFVISNLNIGGPQKSLLALLDNIDYNIFDVSVCTLRTNGQLENYYNKNVNIINAPKIITAATLPNKNILHSLYLFLLNRKYRMLIDSIKAIFNHLIFNKNMNQERQSFWIKHHESLPKIKGNYDMAFGILGLSTYVVVDLVNSKKKLHWIRSDTRILNRNTEIDAFYFQQLDGALSVSKECADIFVNIYPFMKEKVKVLYNLIPISFYNKIEYDKTLISCDDSKFKILTVTRLDPLKGVDLAIDACKKLIDDGYNFKWFILGDGKDKKKIEKMIKSNGLEKVFILLGFQLNTLSYIKDIDIFVHPSRTEGKSNAVDEAKYVGKPIVATNYDTVSEQIENNLTGLVCDMDGKSIAYFIEKLIDNEQLRNELIFNCRNTCEDTVNITQFFLKL